MRPNAVGTFNRPLASVYVYKKFVWVLSGFIEMLIKNILKTLKLIKNIFKNLKTLNLKKNHDLGDTLLHHVHYKFKNEN